MNLKNSNYGKGGQNVIEKITNNFGWKLLSILFAFLLWLIIVNVEDPLTTRTFSDIEVTKINEAIITSEKKAIEYRDGELVTVKVRGKRSVVDRMTADDIYAYADLEKKSITGAIDIQIELPNNITIVEKQPTMMMVKLENIVTVQKEVQPYMEGEPQDGYVYLDPIVTPNYIEVEGPESQVALIKSVLVPVNVEGVTRDVTLYGSPKILDESNNILQGIKKSASQVQIQVPIEKLKTIDIKDSIALKVAEGYELISMTFSKREIQVRGKSAAIDALKSVVVSDIDLSTLTEDTILSVNVDELLPSGINLYNEEQMIEIKIDIEPIISRTYDILQTDILVKDTPELMDFSFVNEEVYTITLKGIAANLDLIDIPTLIPEISLLGLLPGEQVVNLQLTLPTGVIREGEDIPILIVLTEQILPEVPPDTQE